MFSGKSNQLSNSADTLEFVKTVSGNNVKSDHARSLVKALKDFILPIVYAQIPALANSDNSDASRGPSVMEPKAQQLVDALEKFVAALMRPRSSQEDGVENEKDEELPKAEGSSADVLSALDGKVANAENKESPKHEQPQLLKLALEETRYRVFNKMPIRLLAFNSNGSGLELIERSAIWERVSTKMEMDFNEDEMEKMTKRRVLMYGAQVTKAESIALEDFISVHARYAILSHTWLHDAPGEVTYADWKSGQNDTNSPGYQKLSKFCKVAAKEHGITLAWMDTICINKESSAELDESIRSMYKWYRDSSVCVTYLAQTTAVGNMRDDLWFTRGWTLQELLAPRYIKFYGADWRKLVPGLVNDKENNLIQKEIVAATTITANELNLPGDQVQAWESIPISRKMQWAANRRVTREEDTAYSLMGIFSVSISIAYGEGSERAFFRLVQQILNSSIRGVQDIMNWGYGADIKRSRSRAHPSSLIPSSPKQYLWRSERNLNWLPPSIPISPTHLGLHLSVLLMPAISAVNPASHSFYPIGNYYASVSIDEAVVDFIASPSIIYPGQHYNVLEMPRFEDWNDEHRVRMTLGVLNFTTTESMVHLPFAFGLTCFAVCLYFGHSSPAEAVASGNVWTIRTSTSVAFDLHTLRPTPKPWIIPKSELSQHGMQLLDMYL